MYYYVLVHVAAISARFGMNGRNTRCLFMHTKKSSDFTKAASGELMYATVRLLDYKFLSAEIDCNCQSMLVKSICQKACQAPTPAEYG